MKIIYFVFNGKATDEDMTKVRALRGDGHKVVIANGSMPYGFEDRCDAVYLACKSEHIEKWAITAGIEVIKPTPAADSKPKPTVKRGPKPKSEPKPEPTETDSKDETNSEE